MKYVEIPVKTSGIYKIIFPNSKIYIGRAKNIKARIWEHYSKIDNTPCQNALWKYYKTYQEIEIEILEVISPYDFEAICNAEKKWIKYYNANNKEVGYNITSGGDGGGDGINNPASKLSQEDLEGIIKLLKENKTNVFIGNLYNIHPDTVGKINQGKHYYNPEIAYPIRKKQGEVEYKEKYNSFSNETLDLALYLLSTTKLSRAEISQQTGMSTSTITNLNTGKHPYCKQINLTFPLRQTKRTCPLTINEIKRIKEELLNKNFSIQDIANHFNCSRDTISDINQGKRYSTEGESYPIRTFYPNRGAKKPVSTISGTGE